MARNRVKFTFNEKALEKAAGKAAQPVVERLARDLTAMLQGMAGEFEGRPVEEIKPVLQARWARTTSGGSITDPELSQYAEAIAVGRSIEVRADRLR